MRKAMTLLLLLAVLGLGYLLYSHTQNDRAFNLSNAIKGEGFEEAHVQNVVKTTSLTTVSTSNLLEKPRYTGQNDKNQRWEVTALQAHQEGSAASTTLVLNTINARFETATSARPLTLEAPRGQFVQAQNTLLLDGPVIFTGSAGRWAFYIEAQRIEANTHEHRFDLSRGVHARLTPLR